MRSRSRFKRPASPLATAVLAFWVVAGLVLQCVAGLRK
jgi:hypothetical protein